jgi:hypothetical protein
MLCIAALASSLVGCATSRPPAPAGCAGAPVEFGTIHSPILSFYVVNPEGQGVPGFQWRYRKEYGSWSAWHPSEAGGASVTIPVAGLQ